MSSVFSGDNLMLINDIIKKKTFLGNIQKDIKNKSHIFILMFIKHNTQSKIKFLI